MILHITNDYSGSTVYKNLIGELDKLGLSQIVYNPIREGGRIGKNEIEFKSYDSQIIYSHILNKTTDRIFYRKKIKKIIKDIEGKIDFSKIKLIHAHTWYSDGGVAYLLSKKYQIPYIIAVRNTDLNVFYKYLLHERYFGKKILENASNIVLISASYKTRLLDLLVIKNIKENILNKLLTIPNGVDYFWIKNAKYDVKKEVKNEFKFIYIGKFNKGKNVVALQQAIIDINVTNRKSNLLFKLNLVGGGGDEQDKVHHLIQNNSKYFTYWGALHDKNELLKIFEDSHIFAMPSVRETFGLVYIEALSQGLPILYKENEGIDGFYDDQIGEKVISGDVNEIKKKLVLLHDNYSNYKIDTKLILENHNWEMIAKVYEQIYIDILK